METAPEGLDSGQLHSWQYGRWVAIAGWLAVWIYVAVVLLAVIGQPIGLLDESIPLIAARAVHQGRKPAVDFWTFYPPAFYYLLSAGIDVIGQTVLLTRFIAGGLYILFLLAAARFFRREFPLYRPLISWAVLLLAVSMGPNIIFQFWPALALGGISLIVYFRAWESPGQRRDWLLAAGGLLAGLTLFLRVNFGLYIAAVVSLDLLVLRTRSGTARSEDENRLRGLMLFACPFLLSNVIFYLLVYGADAKIVFDQCVVTVQGLMRHFGLLKFSRRLGLLAIVWPFVWLALMVLVDEGISLAAFIPVAMALAIAGIALMLRDNSGIAAGVPAVEIALIAFFHRFVRRIRRPEICLMIFHACCLHYYLSRADIFHLASMWVPTAMLIPYLIFSRSGNPAQERFFSRAMTLAGLGAATYFMAQNPGVKPEPGPVRAGAGRLMAFVRDPGLSDGQRFLASEPGGPWAGITDDQNEGAVIRFVQSVTRPDEAVYVGLADHSRGFVNDIRLYWLLDRPAAVHHAVLDAGTMEAPAQRGMIADLSTREVRYAILKNEEILGTETGYVGSALLDEYLAGHYRKVAQFGAFGIFSRREP